MRFQIKNMDDFVSILKTEILKGLPGTDVQWQMASADRMAKTFPKIPGKDARIAAVLILLYPYKGSIYTVFMQRPDYEGVHGGQISFPGGRKEKSDENTIQTALREANEETGVDSEKIILVGTLSPLFIPVSNTLVTPVVGWIKEKPLFKHQVEEVVFLFDADLRRFFDPSILKSKQLTIGTKTLDVKYFDYEGNMIWGATAMILNELLAILERGRFLATE